MSIIYIVTLDKYEPYRIQVRAALRELMEKGRQRTEIDREMANLRQLIRATANMLPDVERKTFIAQAEEAEPAGFTDTIRKLIETAVRGITPVELRDALPAAGIDLSSQVNPLASIHAVLKRLEKSGHISRRIVTKAGQDDQAVYFRNRIRRL
ncbi:MAG TPA: hypothetical protein VHU89_01500 [Acidobacteriaceae bacterium]|jgi:hypothetical protein|nr:hypothetical protein [Acidobacteriaceae bacterium]